MKKILIIYPHFPPSNLAGVHRPRLFAQHLPSFGWQPIILTVHEDYYEEELDYNLVKLLPADLRIEKVKAFRVSRPRLIGDIGLRAFIQLYRRAKHLIRNEGIDFLFIPVPSFYCALLGRWLHETTRIRYGIDYIDPWVHEFPGSNKLFSRHWFSKQLANMLEPIAVKKASLITGVAEGYYKPVLERNPYLKKNAVYGAMPYGGEKKDHELLEKMNHQPYLFKKKKGKIQMLYAGAMLPKAYGPLKAIFQSISENPELFSDVEFHFIGTGSRANDKNSYTIKPLAEKASLWQRVVFEYPKRIPYLDVLIHLQAVDAVFILGSTEPHYTPSKIYQAVLSGKPILAVLHSESSGVNVIRQSQAGKVMAMEKGDMKLVERSFPECFKSFRRWIGDFDRERVEEYGFEMYSAFSVTAQLAGLLKSIHA